MKDSERSHVHLTTLRSVLYFEQWMEDSLAFDDIHIKPEHMPVNIDEDDDAIPDPHAPFGIMRVKQMSKQSQWKDLALKDLLDNGPGYGDNTIVSSVSVPQWSSFTGNSNPNDGFRPIYGDSNRDFAFSNDKMSNSSMLDGSDLTNRSSLAHELMESLESDVSDPLVSQGNNERINYTIPSAGSIGRNSSSDDSSNAGPLSNERRETFGRIRAPR
ncbi:hypothetical protein NADFUDRAFT_46387 [Nadsonia fulvescens var. elongata DSM 6958]|uniref:Uncharacterized protein n=1 Tax=Nadsonia fulvescens var. elongata DSM 6958 TaxID=857566 RepID=A0A1E3PK06_9ASCO|nr:hypothetical protein NADFUDRAFT_46387 [Nadsonia fulvescens var. elongata DSM 6958]